MTAAERLAAARNALAEAEQKLRDAELADVEGLIAAQQVANRLRDEIHGLQVEAAREAEVDALAEAAALVKALRVAYAEQLARFKKTYEQVEEQIRACGPAVSALNDAHAAAAWLRQGVDLLQRRFGLQADAALPDLPAPPSVADVVYDADGHNQRRTLPQKLLIGAVANDSPAQLAAKAVAAAHQYARQFAHYLPPSVVSLLDKVPVPDLAPPPTEQQRKKMAQAEQQGRVNRNMQARIAAEEKAHAAIRKHDTPEAREMREERRRLVARQEAATRKRIVEEARQDEAVRKATRGKGPLAPLREP